MFVFLSGNEMDNMPIFSVLDSTSSTAILGSDQYNLLLPLRKPDDSFLFYQDFTHPLMGPTLRPHVR